MRPTSGYRDPAFALDARRREHIARLGALDDHARIAGFHALSPQQRARIADLRQQAESRDDSAAALAAAEEALEACEHLLDEELSLHAELHKTLDSWLPPLREALSWAGFALLALASMGVTVHQLELDDFMLAAVGMKAYRPAIELGPSAVVDAHTLHRAAAMRRCAPLPLDDLLGCRALPPPEDDPLPYFLGARPEPRVGAPPRR